MYMYIYTYNVTQRDGFRKVNNCKVACLWQFK